jgi:transcriptional regulator with XRE-family HTH domain
MIITGKQLVNARELIGLSQLALAVHFQIGVRRVIAFEAGEPAIPNEVLVHLRAALEAAGVEFFMNDVRLKNQNRENDRFRN